MMGYGFGHWIAFIVVAVAFLYPIGKVLRRVGFSPLWSLLAVVPFVNLVALWVFAFTDWLKEGHAGR
jgi:hypothetical protein